MAFLIEKLTQKQREQFEMKQIRNPLSPVLGQHRIISTYKQKHPAKKLSA